MDCQGCGRELKVKPCPKCGKAWFRCYCHPRPITEYEACESCAKFKAKMAATLGSFRAGTKTTYVGLQWLVISATAKRAVIERGRTRVEINLYV